VVDDRGPDDDPTSEQSVPHLLAAIDGLERRIGREMGQRLERAGIQLRGSEGRILGLIAPSGSRPTELAEGAWITKQAIGMRIRQLEQRGLVAMRPDPDDGRGVLVHRTSAGDRAMRITEQAIADMENQLADELGRMRYRAFRQVLDTVARAELPDSVLRRSQAATAPARRGRVTGR